VRRWIVALGAVATVAGLAFAPLPVEDTTRIHSSVEIARDPDVVFAYVTTPANWPTWHPSSLAVSGAVDHPLDIGEQVTEDFLVAGRRGRAVWTVVESEAPERWVIAGEVGGRPRERSPTLSRAQTPGPASTVNSCTRPPRSSLRC
jgi:hypothetical protein